MGVHGAAHRSPRMALRALTGRVTNHELNAFEAEEIWVQTEIRWINVSTDGEVTVVEAPLHYRIRPRALGVTVPVGRFRHVANNPSEAGCN